LVEIVAGRHSAAERHLGEARDVFRRAGDRWGLAAALWRSADLAIVRGNLDDAEAYLTEAYEVLRETQRDRWLGNTLLGLAEVAALRGDLGRASDLLTEARERHVARADGQGVATVEARIAELQRTRKGDEKPAPIRLSPTRRKEMT
jgi:ATP/maltotriose-dependent transcriptional regulator MalT